MQEVIHMKVNEKMVWLTGLALILILKETIILVIGWMINSMGKEKKSFLIALLTKAIIIKDKSTVKANYHLMIIPFTKDNL